VSQAVPPGIGSRLRKARIERALSIEETAWRTRIRPDLLRALEDEDFAEIGHRAFVRSHLASYARFLGLDPKEVMGEFERTWGGEPSSIEELDRQARDARKPPRARWLVASALSGALLIAAAVVGLLGGQDERPIADPSSVSSVPASASPTPSVVTVENARVELVVEALADTSLTVRADDEEVFEGILASGARRTFRALAVVEVAAANAGTVRVTLNGEELGTLGEPGTVTLARFGPEGRIDS